MKISTICVIPARLESKRLSRKVLLRETGKPLIQHTYEQASKARLVDKVVVATDNVEISHVVQTFGGNVFLSAPRSNHWCGSSRVAEAVSARAVSCIVNLQADEPEIDPAYIDEMIIVSRAGAVETLCTPFRDDSSKRSPDNVKVVTDATDYAMYFTRADVPVAKLHLGVYCFRPGHFLSFARPQCELAKKERLEQLQLMWHGVRIHCVEVPTAMPGIDNEDDYKAFVRRYDE